jgi:GT2 family glycosyltransferase
LMVEELDLEYTNSKNFEILLVQNNFNYGYAYGNNIGIKIAYKLGFKYLMVLNNDTLFVEDCISKLKAVLETNKSVLCAGPMLLRGDNVSIDYNCAKRRPTYFDIFLDSHFGKYFRTNTWRKKYYILENTPNVIHPIKVDVISGSCMLFNTSNFSDIDFFDESTFLYYEEVILTEKAREKGLIIMLEPNAKVIHLGAKTTSEQSSNLFLLTCNYDSLKIYLNKYRKVSGLKLFVLTLSARLSIYAWKLKYLFSTGRKK